FDALYLSYEMRVMKPDRRIFEMMLEGEQAVPDETVFIDDSAHNVAAAAALGIHTLQPDNGGDWHAMLEQLLTDCAAT
ncbi:MAG: HAD-IA family hydrolase, partial [Muribaculaceae bacterium]|nr:HAD-IA family hydrolase [Muribaculaceae bacterium]